MMNDGWLQHFIADSPYSTIEIGHIIHSIIQLSSTLWVSSSGWRSDILVPRGNSIKDDDDSHFSSHHQQVV